MVLTIDPLEKTVEIFDSNGTTPNTWFVYAWADKLSQYLSLHYNERFIIKRVHDELFCPQMLTIIVPDVQEQCGLWSYWYIWLRIHNPNMNPKDIRKYMSSFPPDKFYDKLQRIATFVYS